MVKILLIGDSRVGKTSLRKRYIGEGFQQSYTQTLGAEFSTKKFRDTTITIFDLGGDPQTKIFRSQYYPGAQGILMIFDINNRESFENLDNWFDEIRSAINSRLRVFVLGNKDDLRQTSTDPVSEYEAYQYTQKIANELDSSVSYLSTSALTGYNVEVAFSKLLAEIEFD